jgi:hypothetical protein
MAILQFTSFVKVAKTMDITGEFAEYAIRLVRNGFSYQKNDKLSPVLNEQKDLVYQLIAVHGVFNSALIKEEVEYFYTDLGISSFYFEHFSPQMIAKHIHTFIAGKKSGQSWRRRSRY